MQYILQRECVVQCSLNYKCKSWVVQNTSVYFYLGVCCIKMYYIFFQCETNLKRHQWMYLIELASKVTASCLIICLLFRINGIFWRNRIIRCLTLARSQCRLCDKHLCLWYNRCLSVAIMAHCFMMFHKVWISIPIQVFCQNYMSH